MLFNSIEYLFFLPIVFLIYWAIGYARIKDSLKLRLQNAFVVLASYVFYGWWDWRFLLLIAFTSFCSYASGLLIIRGNQKNYKKNTESSADTDSISTVTTPQSTHKQASGLLDDSLRSKDIVAQYPSDNPAINTKNNYSAKFWLIANIVLNLGILAIFKYYDFFVSEFGALFGISTESLLLRIILPVGISFYTFQALSYSIDVYRGNIKPTKDIIAFFAFISFFPQLVAGPIERATNLLPQFLQNRKFSYEQGVDGMRQILWGLFKKIVIADNCATYVDQVWSTYGTQSGSTLLLAAVLFTFQIYGDFSGYSDIAIGTAKLFGIKLMRNFNNPYFSRDIAEFWRRWHISLTTWFRDYVYIPLGGSRNGQWRTIANTFIVFLLCAIWHGANWTYLVWGVYHVMLFIPLILMNLTHRYKSGEWKVESGKLKEILQMSITFVLVTIGWVMFRAPSVADAWGYICTMCTAGWSIHTGLDYTLWVAITMIGVTLGVEWRAERGVSRVQNVWFYYVLIGLIWWFAGHHTTEFIYFQF